MTSTDRLAEMADAELRAKFGDAAVEILRLRARDLAAFDEIRDLRQRITELEALVTVGHGTMGTLELGTGPSGDEPATITHDHPPSAPPHDEPQPPIGHTIKWPTRTGDDNE